LKINSIIQHSKLNKFETFLSMTATLVLHQTRFSVSREALIANCGLFTANPKLANSVYAVQSSVDVSILGVFVGAIEGQSISITDANWLGLWQLSGEFQFRFLVKRLSTSFESFVFLEGEVTERLRNLEERVSGHDRLLATFRNQSENDRQFVVKELKKEQTVEADRITAIEKDLSLLKREISRLDSAAETVLPRLKYGRHKFKPRDEESAFHIAVFGLPGDSDRRLALIEWMEQTEYFFPLEFQEIEGDSALPDETDGVVICGPSLPVGWEGVSVKVGFSEGYLEDADVVVNVRTGEGVKLVLALLFLRIEGSDDFEFVNGGRILRVTGDAPGDVRVWGRAEASRTVRIVVADGVRQIGGLLGPLLPNVTEIELPLNCFVMPRTLGGLRISRVIVGGSESDVRESLGLSCLGFETAPWTVTFGAGENVSAALGKRKTENGRHLAGGRFCSVGMH
jgi:hypothetical protein